jgi:hypothetical protein
MGIAYLCFRAAERRSNLVFTKEDRMKKILSALLAMASISSAAVGWGGSVHVQEVWIAPGPTPVVRITTDESSGQYYAFYLNSTGHADMVKLAQEALAQNLYIKIYADRGYSSGYNTGSSAPWVTSVSAQNLYSLAIAR